ncbi:hypothetical protein B0H14DRAFT_3484144 [Mycena olivaceomarginata]|nr:hypothetical protein B0H14DRAFT_3484144 [Mycena olivaceomarginata]
MPPTAPASPSPKKRGASEMESSDVVQGSSASVNGESKKRVKVAEEKPPRQSTEAVHDQKYDPNFSMLIARNEQELAAKASGLQGMFLPNWQAALEKYIADPAGGEYKDFYEPRIVANGGLLEIFTRKAPADVQAGYFVQSQAHFDAVRSALFEIYPELLPTGGLIGGKSPGRTTST